MIVNQHAVGIRIFFHGHAFCGLNDRAGVEQEVCGWLYAVSDERQEYRN